MEVSGQLHASAALSPVKETLVPMDRRLGGPQNQAGHCGEEKNSQPLAGLKLPIIQPVAQCYNTELSQLLCLIYQTAFWLFISDSNFCPVWIETQFG
jgi:hypothetical protein